MVASTGETALLEQVLCSDPPATTTTWQWDQVVLGPGGSVDTRYRAELEPHPIMSQCHTSRLLVEGVDRGDSGKYVVRAENERGMDMVTVQLLVQDSLSMVSVIGVTISLLVVLLIIVVIITISYNQHRLCFKGDQEKKEPGDPGAEADEKEAMRSVPVVYPPLATKV